MVTAIDLERWASTQSSALPDIPDGAYFYIHFAGGLRASKRSQDVWTIEPLFIGGVPARSRAMSKGQMQSTMKHLGREPLGFHDHMWIGGSEHQHWAPYIGRPSSLSTHPASRWANIASHYASRKDTAAKPVRILADAISISLRGMDLAFLALSDFYFYRLIEGLRAGGDVHVRTATSMDASLAVHVHSFVMHFGAARDYLGALIAHRAGMDFTSRKNDSLVGVVDQLGVADVSKEPLFGVFLQQDALDGDGKPIGWLKELSELRNSLVHRSPYGHHFDETYGRLCEVGNISWMLAYERSLVREGKAPEDLLKLLGRLYRSSMTFYWEAALASGYNSEGWKITDQDIVGEPEVFFSEK